MAKFELFIDYSIYGEILIWLNFRSFIKTITGFEKYKTLEVAEDTYLLANYSAYYRTSDDMLVFKTEEDMTKFILRFS